MMTVLLIIHSVTNMDTSMSDNVISAVHVRSAKMELTEPVVRAEMDTPLKRAVIALQEVLPLDRRNLQVMCSERMNLKKWESD